MFSTAAPVRCVHIQTLSTITDTKDPAPTSCWRTICAKILEFIKKSIISFFQLPTNPVFKGHAHCPSTPQEEVRQKLFDQNYSYNDTRLSLVSQAIPRLDTTFVTTDQKNPCIFHGHINAYKDRTHDVSWEINASHPKVENTDIHLRFNRNPSDSSVKSAIKNTFSLFLQDNTDTTALENLSTSVMQNNLTSLSFELIHTSRHYLRIIGNNKFQTGDWKYFTSQNSDISLHNQLQLNREWVNCTTNEVSEVSRLVNLMIPPENPEARSSLTNKIITHLSTSPGGLSIYRSYTSPTTLTINTLTSDKHPVERRIFEFNPNSYFN